MAGLIKKSVMMPGYA
jgi:hypothetical protein